MHYYNMNIRNLWAARQKKNGHRFRELYRESNQTDNNGTHTHITHIGQQIFIDDDRLPAKKIFNEAKKKMKDGKNAAHFGARLCCLCARFSYRCPILRRSFIFRCIILRCVWLVRTRAECVCLDIACYARFFVFFFAVVDSHISLSTTLSEVAFKYVYTIIFWEVSYITIPYNSVCCR